MIRYATFYRVQNALIFNEGYSKFHNMFKNNPDLLNMDIDKFAMILSIASHHFTQKVYIPDRLYQVSGITEYFISNTISGRRCMTCCNKKYLTTIPLSDFYTVGLYTYTVLRHWTVHGISTIILPEHLNLDYLHRHSFTEN